MKSLFKLMILGGAAYLAVRFVRSQQASPGKAQGPTTKHGNAASGIEDAVQDADLVMGISDVDPTPLSGMGEAIDPDANAEAHNAGRKQRERMPVPGKNVL